MQLWPHQERALASIALSTARKLLVVSPTGSGKTTIGCELVKQQAQHGRPVLWLTHRVELIDQVAERLAQYGIACGVIRADDRRTDATQPVQVASVQTLTRRVKPPAELVVVDEAHHAAADSYQRILSHYPTQRVIGLTATPWRTDGRGLGEHFDDLLVAANYSELIEQGIIIRPTIYTQSIDQLARIKTVAGDYDQGGLSELMSRDALIADSLAMHQRYAAGLSTIVYCVSKVHALAVKLRYESAGIRCDYLDTDSPMTHRVEVNENLRKVPGFVVTQCNIFSEGLDFPQLFCCQVLRPTKSKTLWMQMTGRVMRSYPGKQKCVVLDHGGCVKRLGDPSKDRKYYLESDRGISQKIHRGEAEEGGHACRYCGAWIPTAGGYCTAMVPDAVGGLMPCAGAQVPVTIAAELTEYTPRVSPKNAKNDIKQASPDDSEIGSLPDYRYCWKCGSTAIRASRRGEYWSIARCVTCNAEKWLATRRKNEYSIEEMAYRLEKFKNNAMQKGYHRDWVKHEFRRHYGRWPYEVGLSVMDQLQRQAPVNLPGGTPANLTGGAPDKKPGGLI